jgi:ATP-dependent exoDNAse (exonuclease V) beta subunit
MVKKIRARKQLRSLRDDSLIFSEEEHSYVKGDQVFTSATTWIKSFNPPFKGFDSALWAPRSAAKRGISTEEMLAEWKATGDAASAKGTKVHNEIERYILIGEPVTEPLALFGLAHLAKRRGLPHPEVRIYSEKLGIAGTIDGVYAYANGNVDLIDWKTNSKLDGGYTFGLDDYKKLPDTKLMMYYLQLSLYGYILEKEYGRKVKSLKIVHLTTDGAKEIEVPYLKHMIEQMIEAKK